MSVDGHPAGGRLSLFTIYLGATDTPAGRYLVREWIVLAGRTVSGQAWACPSLDAARLVLPPGVSYRIGRDDDDEPQIVESWI